MSREPHPPTDQTTPGSTPAQEPGAASELERQRAESDYPGRPKPDALGAESGEDADTSEDIGEEPDTRSADVEVPPDESVPDEVAERAAKRVDPLTADPDPGMQHQNPMRPATSTSEIQKDRPPADDL